MKNVIILDNNPNSFSFHPFNGIPIESYLGNKLDDYLQRIKSLLIFLSKVDDVREYIPRFIRNYSIAYEYIEKLITKFQIEEHKLKDEEKKKIYSTSKLIRDTDKKIIIKTPKFIFNNFIIPNEFENPLDSSRNKNKSINIVKTISVHENSFHYSNMKDNLKKEGKSNNLFKFNQGNLKGSFLENQMENPKLKNQSRVPSIMQYVSVSNNYSLKSLNQINNTKNKMAKFVKEKGSNKSNILTFITSFLKF